MARGPRNPEVGDDLGRYRLVQELGRGGMAVVFRAEDPTLDRQVAIKVMLPHLWGQPEYARRFSLEARAVAALHHPNIVEVHDFDEGQQAEGLPGYIVSEFVEGPTLREFIDRHGCPFPEVAAMIVRKLAEALRSAHQQGIVHRDLKPENVMIARGGRVVLTDFGIARIVEGESVTQTGAMLGSPAYMSPEQARGLPVDARSDLFSLGVVLYLLCTGQLPFLGKDPISTVLAIVEGRYEPGLRRNPRIGSRLDRVIRKLLQSEPDQRHGSAQEVMADLDHVLQEAGIEHVDRELERYFEDPGSFNRTLLTQVLQRSLTLAQQASESGDYPRALALCDRVLSFEPEHTEALELMARVSSAGRRPRVLVWVGLALLLGGVAIGGLYWHLRPGVDRVAADASVAHAPDMAPDLPAADVLRADLAPVADVPRPGRRPRRNAVRWRGEHTNVRPVDAAALIRPDARPPRADASVPRPTHGEIVVAIGIWCDVYLDGKLVGRSPMRDRPLKLTPGLHEVVCRQGAAGPFVRHQVRVEAGKRQTLTGLLQSAEIEIRLQLTHGDAVRIDGVTYRERRFRLVPSRRRVDVLAAGQPVPGRGGWIAFTRSCLLVDEPRLACRP